MEILLGRRIKEVQDHGVKIGDEWVMAQTVVWAAGVSASPAARWLGVEPGQGGRVPVEAGLSVAGFPEIYVIGDTASCPDGHGGSLPGVAPVAKQQGRHVAKTIIARICGKPSFPFRYRNYGNMATIGRKRAVADFGRFRVSGFPAWILWCVIHILFLSNHRNRLTVGMSWLWNYVTFERNARLITGIDGERATTLLPKAM